MFSTINKVDFDSINCNWVGHLRILDLSIHVFVVINLELSFPSAQFYMILFTECHGKLKKVEEVLDVV